MKRSLKNIIMVVLIVLMFGTIYLTMNYAKNNITVNNEPGNNMEQKEMPTGNNDNNMEEPPAKPDGDNESNMEEPPEKPEGDNENNMGEPPEKPEGNNESNMGEPPEMPNNMMVQANITWIYYLVFGTLSLIIASLIMYLIMSNFNKKNFKETFVNKDKILINILGIIILTGSLTYLSGLITNNYFLGNNNINNTNNMPNNMNNNISYSASLEINEDKIITNENYESTNSDENAVLVSGEVEVSISDSKITKTGDSDGGDNTSFYGTNSGIIAKDGANLTLINLEITTDATGANGVFSYGGSATTNNTNSDGTTITISDSIITTNKDNSGGIMTTGGGTMIANNLTINTSGVSSAAIRSDRGGGNVTVNGGTYTTFGAGSPSIYSTANIKVSNAKLISNASEGIVIEGKNSVSIDNTTLTDTNNKLNGQSTTYKNVFLYQSMSGDASVGNSTFAATNSNIITNKGDTFYITNTSAIINLENNTITNNDSAGNFLRAQSDSWGTKGSNGGEVTLNMTNQKALGNIVIDNISTLEMNLKNNSYYEGVINSDNSAKEINLILDNSSMVKLTGDSYVTSLVNSVSDNSNIDFNGYKLYVNGTAIN